ncbi:signal recognition particle-docking protein FtsY [Mannheimia sp. AT1]|uniref:Signal recognition particle receptor FtsY n=1 Tax=Mannheimia cairinae TaxID=3025936 RepID=A0ABT5MSB7_9PAST|nr:signal recognition particle-docking protein FtsY [Mannheimia cairinae]MDD0824486.1 signal recognition particle-docking protein FtsY [Mannheimia cairinae]MDD0825587.1 signal recognition particle-docking protein FtsY [Mannheimia cairinae]
MSEKKKGFWSWLGFGKKEESQPESVVQEEKQIPSQELEPSLTEKFEDKVEQLDEQAEQKSEQFEEYLEDKSEQLEEYLENKEDEIEQFAEQAEDKFEQAIEDAKEFIEEKVENVKEFFDDIEEKIEQAFEEEKQESVSITNLAENLEENAEQAVENLQNFANEQLDLNEQEKIANQIEEAIEAEPVEELYSEAVDDSSQSQTDEQETIEDEYQEKPSQGGFFSRLIQGLIKTKQNIGSGFRNFFSGKKIDDELFEELEEQLLVADLGMPTTQKIINNLTQHATKQQLKDADLLYQQLKIELGEVLKPIAQPLVLEQKVPYVILMVGVNGVGKTTTIGKLARKFQNEGKSVMLAAGDTFRAAAVEQLQVWGERNNIPVVAQSTGSDSASVIFDAMQSAAAKGIDVLIADTAGRLQNKNNLMDELKKIVRVMKKYDETAPHEIMLTLDAGTGQNAISQAKLFNEAVGLTGITLTKLDGTAKGGVIFAIADQFNIPIRFIGVGEKIEDLRPFNAEEFIEALFSHEDENND